MAASPIALTAGPGNDTHPRWSPDGQQLAFLSTRDGEQDGGKAQIYVMPAAVVERHADSARCPMASSRSPGRPMAAAWRC